VVRIHALTRGRERVKETFLRLKSKIMNTENNPPKDCSVCGVPTHLHGTCCGWTNASLIIDPIADVEKEWQRKWLEANNGELTINKDGTFLIINKQ
jgi:hypothetical protein